MWWVAFPIKQLSAAFSLFLEDPYDSVAVCTMGMKKEAQREPGHDTKHCGNSAAKRDPVFPVAAWALALGAFHCLLLFGWYFFFRCCTARAEVITKDSDGHIGRGYNLWPWRLPESGAELVLLISLNSLPLDLMLQSLSEVGNGQLFPCPTSLCVCNV